MTRDVRDGLDFLFEPQMGPIVEPEQLILVVVLLADGVDDQTAARSEVSHGFYDRLPSWSGVDDGRERLGRSSTDVSRPIRSQPVVTMQAQEIMNRFFVTIRPTDSVQVAVDAMANDGVGIVSVCDARGAPVGVITDRDVVTRVCFKHYSCEDLAAGSVMTPHPLTCSPDSPMEEVESQMERRGVGRVLVTDSAGELVGVITLAEIWHSESPLVAGAVSRRLSERQLRVPPTGGHYDAGGLETRSKAEGDR